GSGDSHPRGHVLSAARRDGGGGRAAPGRDRGPLRARPARCGGPPTLPVVGTVTELRERLAERVARLDLRHVVLQLRDDGGSGAGRSRGALRPALIRRAT